MRSFKDLQDEVLNLGFNDARYRARIKTWLNEGLHRVARNSQLLDGQSTLNTVAGQSLALPGTNLRVRAVRNTTTGRILDAITLDAYQQAFEDNMTATGSPEAYTVLNGQLLFVPAPDKAYPMEITFWGNPADFVGDTDTVTTIGLPAGADDYLHVLVDYAAYKAYRNEDDPEMATFYFNEFQREAQAMRADLGIRVSPMKRQIGGMAADAYPGPRFRLPGR